MSNKILLLISLCIAFILWIHVFISEDREVTVRAPIALIGEKEGTIAFITPNEADVTLSVPQALVGKAANDVHIILQVDDYAPGVSHVKLQSKDVKASGFDVLDLSPTNFELEIQPTQIKELRVQPFILEEPVKGYKVGTVTVSPPTAKVEGAKDAIRLMDNIQTSYISVGGLSEDHDFIVPFQQYSNIKFIDPSTVTVHVSIVPDNIIQEYSASQVKCLPGKQLPEVKGYPYVSLKVSGRRDLVESITADTTLAYIDCSMIGRWGTYYLKVIPAELNGLRVWGIEPETVGLEVLP